MKAIIWLIDHEKFLWWAVVALVAALFVVIVK